MHALPEALIRCFDRVSRDRGKIVVLTGAGISAESGIPTFRGAEGYWTIGSTNYHPMELATFEAFTRMPDEVWAWYLYRRAVCRRAAPNPAHVALAALERACSDRFVLITQNIDGLHLRAGNTLERTYQIHGNIDAMRCSRECSTERFELPAALAVDWPKGAPLTDAERALLRCPRCGERSRPHVLWFDEYYDEEHFRFQSSMAAAEAADLLVVIGSTGSTNLPLHVGSHVARRGVPIVVVNPEPNPFTSFAEQVPEGTFLLGTAGQWVPAIGQALEDRLR